VFGPGAAAGTFAIAFRSVGFVGKLLAEAIEEAPPARSRRWRPQAPPGPVGS
jgi:phosphonate transport system permease protein